MITINRKNPTEGEVTSSLTNAEDGGLHFDGAAGYVDISSPPDLGTKFSWELVIKADTYPTSSFVNFIDFGTGGRLALVSDSTVDSNNLALWDTAGRTFGVKVLDDLKVHHLVVTINGTAAILYDNGNQVGTATLGANSDIDSCADAAIAARFNGASGFFDGTISRTRFYNCTLSGSEVKEKFENKNLEFSEQWGSQTELSTNTFVNSGFAGFSGNAAGFTTSGSASNNAVYKNQTFTAGKKYRLKFTIADGNSGNLLLLFRSSTGGAGANVGKIDSSNLGTIVSDNYLQLEATGNYELILSDLGSAQSIRIYAGGDVGAINISAFTVVAVGAVSSYELQSANPTQSLMVQDSSGAADGTCSASGVSQIQPLTQLNSKAIAVSAATARTPSDGAIVADNLGIGIAPSSRLHINDNGVASYSSSAAPTPQIKIETSGNTNGAYTSLMLGTRGSSGTARGVYLTAVPDGDGDNALAVSTADDYNTAERFRISANGNATMSGLVTINKDGLAVKIDGTANTAKGILLRNTGNQHGYLHTDGNMKLIAEDAGKTMSFYTADDGTGAARMVIDSTGNLNQAGGKYVLSDGSGASVGEISTLGGNNFTISSTQSNHCGLSFATQAILPCTQSATNDNTVDLGADGNSFKDLYLAGLTMNGSGGTASIHGENSITLANDGTTTFEAYGSVFAIYQTDGQGALFFNEYQSATVEKLAGSTQFVAGTASGNIRVWTAANDATVNVRNYSGSNATIKIVTLGM